MPTTFERRQAFRRGHLAEAAAAWLLRCKGYRIVGRRVRTPMGEIDLIARRGGTLAFVEVKARPSRDAALEAVSPRQARRLVAAARWWLSLQPPATASPQVNGDWRFDIVVVSPYLLPRHLPNAFGADLW
jgi:putative endonuclease